MKVLITGATGLIGQEIVRQCHSNNMDVNYLSTSRSKIEQRTDYQGYYWNPKTKEIDFSCFEGVDVIINLAGSPIAKRWTKPYKKEILDSRIEGLKLLYDTIKDRDIKIKHLLSASAIGIYPDSLTNYYQEEFEFEGEGFLSEVTAKWENQISTFKSLDIKVAMVRIGIVLSSDGGALPQLAKPVKMGLGSAMGKGEQWQSWIHIKDLAALFLYILTNGLEGVFNGVAPNALKQRELIKAIAKVLRKPMFLPSVPSALLKLVLGEMSAVILESQHVSSQKAERLGFNFKYHHIKTALEDLL